ncbi:MAG TPA: hypothetical protein VLN49_01250 [Gemmatimonadaceae bacterium]|nr:hypothetical protein [Gemmatimonadaceae bacterium]
MKIQYALAVVGLSALLAAPVHAQSTVKKAADQTHHVLKKTGKAVKETAKDAGSTTHHALKKAGNKTKEEAGEVTGIHKTGGEVGEAAQTVSHTGKKLGARAKHTVKHAASVTHDSLTKAGKDAKAAVKKP